MTATPIYTATIHGLCDCDAPQAAAVAALMTEGIEQRDASLIVYRGQLPDNAGPAVIRAWCARHVRAEFAELRAGVGMS